VNIRLTLQKMKSKETDNPKATEKDPPNLRGEYLTNVLKTMEFGPVFWVEETGSTNADLLEKSSSNKSDGMVVIADFQTSGRGRRDRKWIAEPEKALLMSVNFIADAEKVNLGVFASGMAIASCEAIKALGFDKVQIKWPNDLVISNDGSQAKLAGVLAQSKILNNRASVVVGIGINVHSSNIKEIILERDILTLSDLGTPPDRVELAESILSILAGLDFHNPNFWERYRSYSATIGQAVRVSTERETLEGTARDVTDTGSLLIEDNQGIIYDVTSGDLVSLRPL